MCLCNHIKFWKSLRLFILTIATEFEEFDLFTLHKTDLNYCIYVYIWLAFLIDIPKIKRHLLFGRRRNHKAFYKLLNFPKRELYRDFG